MIKELFSPKGKWNRLNRKRFFLYGLIFNTSALLLIALLEFIFSYDIEFLNFIFPENLDTRTQTYGYESLPPGYFIVAILQIILFYLITLFSIWGNLCLGIKRLHDLNKSGWMVLLYIIPIFHFYLLFSEGNKGPNKYGPDPLSTQ